MCTAREPRVHCVRADRLRRLLATQQDRRPRPGPPRRAARQRRRLSSATARRFGLLGRALQAPDGATHCAAQGSWEAAVRPCDRKAVMPKSPILRPSTIPPGGARGARAPPQPDGAHATHRALARVRAGGTPTPAFTPTPACIPTLTLILTLSFAFCAFTCLLSHPRPPPIVPGHPQPARLRCATATPRHTIRGRWGGMGRRRGGFGPRVRVLPCTINPPRAVGPRSAWASQRWWWRRRRRRRRRRRQ